MSRRAILVHGLWMPWWVMVPLGRALRAEGFEVSYFRYASTRTAFRANVGRLAALLSAAGDDGVQLLVAHSLGGLLSCAAIERIPGRPLPRMIVLGSPLAGSVVAREVSRWHLGAWRFGRQILGHAGPCLRRGARRLPPGVFVHAIAGVSPFGPGTLLGVLRDTGDGTVGLEETRLKGLASHTVVPANHTAMLVHPGVRRRVLEILRGGLAVAFGGGR